MKTSQTPHQKYRIAVLNGRDVRKFVNLLKKLGAQIVADHPVMKRIEDADGAKLFSALKYSSGWDCRVHSLIAGKLQNILKH